MSEAGYTPEKPIALGPLYQRPFKPLAFLKWLFGVPGYFVPYQALFFGIAAVCWFWLTPDASQMRDLSYGWIGLILLRNAALLITAIALCHWWLYIRKGQGTQYKYNSDWPAARDSTFLFHSQLWDNVFWTVCSAIPIWTFYEVTAHWLYANNYLWSVTWTSHPIYLSLQFILANMWLNIHFYFGHRMLHWEPLYKFVHSLHHKNANFGPWSGLAMHPVEHLVYFSGVLLFWIIPSHPLMSMYVLIDFAFGALLSHHGFDRIVVGKDRHFSTDHYMHYLHHKYTRVNFSTDTGTISLDKLLGTFHDGSAEAHERMKQRARERILRVRAKTGRGA